MSDRESSLEHQIIQLAAQKFGRRRICKQLHVGEHCVSKTLHEFHDVGVIPAPLSRGRPSKITNAILDFIDIHTLQTAHVSGAHLIHRVTKARALVASRYRTDADHP
jgi:transposase